MDDPKKRGIALLVLSSLGLGAYYLLKEDFKELKTVQKSDSPVVIEEKKEDPWSAMTWDKLELLLGSRCIGRNLPGTYYKMSEDEKMSWRRAVYKSAETSLDRAFVYLDSQIISQVYSLRELKDAVSKYSKNRISFEDLYALYKNALQNVFGIR
ncbi:hypothetical protein [Candidatus Aciduliprofundum boonei]|uniref:Uncharacterized protein n=1 Tax=Aciduliprofundum boonei (strain DSM 19572 / T469) TaxID=439481 RepID=B5IFJ4_ACIB4|nr:hypothetical protein [Candidatus Aciduliprofundum boonei]ADD08920.1 hypothetical protein Aboo_1111 [Aciduliprofundum boonei T469]EDY34948.1 hypothetical protein ABOONEI_1214 [Aciduliprofundum boonei T469]HII54765.1 hypothetical protein [Candidatus Aciduliprofundum boonei]